MGRVLRHRLHDASLTFSERAQLDIDEPESLRRALREHEQVVHLASPLRRPMWTEEDLKASVRMTRQVLEAAREAGVKRVILPSSVLATSGAQLRGTTVVSVADAEPPDTEYGRTRLEFEALGRTASESGLEVICIRLGAVRHPDAPSHRPELRTQWLSHEDCAALIRACLSAPIVPGRFSLFYAVSDLKERILDVSNPFGWTPRTKTVGLRRSVVVAVHRLNTGIRGRLQIRTRLRTLFARAR